MTTIRVWFTKVGESAYISLLDLQRVMQRAFKRSRLPAWYTQGFNPHIYMTFAAPLALGQESLVESLDFKTEAETLDWVEAAKTLTECLPQGIDVVRVEPAKMNPNEIAYARYKLQYETPHAQAAAHAFQNYENLSQAIVLKKAKGGKQKEVDLKQYVELCDTQKSSDEFSVIAKLPAGSVLNVNPALLLSFLEENFGLPGAAANILRTELLTKTKEQFC